MMYNSYEGFSELLESDESDNEDFEGDYQEASRPRPRRVSTARSGNPVPQATAAGYATKAELQATAQRLDGRIATNSKAISTVDARTHTLTNDVGKLRQDIRREISERRTVTEALRKGLDDQRQLALMLPLLSTQTTTTVDGVSNVVIDDGDQMSKLLPILLLSGGLGGSSTNGTGSGGGLFGGGDNMLATLAIMMAMTAGK